MQVGLLTEEQKDLLIGVQYDTDIYFLPHQDVDGNWIISKFEMDNTVNPDYQWIKDIPLIELKYPNWD